MGKKIFALLLKSLKWGLLDVHIDHKHCAIVMHKPNHLLKIVIIKKL